MGPLWQDLRYAVRMLVNSPGFTAVALATLALGIGVNTAIFTLIDVVLLSKLPVQNPQELVLFSDDPSQGTLTGTETGHWFVFSHVDYLYFRQHNESFQDLCAFQEDRNHVRVRVAGTKEGSTPESARSKLVSGNYFKLLGVNAIAGRTLKPEDDRAGASPAAVLSYAYWKRRFNSDASVVGRILDINEVPFTIVGVAPPEFFGESFTSIPNFWLPISSMQPQAIQRSSYLDDPSTHWLDIMGRLRTGVTWQQAQTGVNVQLRQMLIAQAGAKLSADTQHDIDRSHIQLAPGDRGISELRARYSEPLHILMAVVAVVLLIACANVANLLLSRAAAREKEISVRLAMGASRGRLIRQLLTESVLLAAFGGVLGILFARWGAKILLVRVAGIGTPFQVSPNIMVLGFTAGVSVLAGVLFGMFPALRASRSDLTTAIKGTAPKAGAAGLRMGFANGLVVFQVAASLVLLVSAGLFLRTLRKLVAQELGFDEDRVLIVGMDPQLGGYKPEQMQNLYRVLLDSVGAVPGVRSVSYEYTSPLSGNESSGAVSIEGMPPRPRGEMGLHRNKVGPHYFETMGIPIVLGRGIELQDGEGSPGVAVINQAMVRKFFGGANPIGKRFSEGWPDFDAKNAFQVVGVARDARFYSLREQVPPMAFVAAAQLTSSDQDYGRDVDVRAAGDPRMIETAVRRVIGELARSLPITNVRALRDQVSGRLEQDRTVVGLSSTFGGMALLVACIGLYGVMAYRVARRTGEVGIRMALGAQRANILWMVMRECVWLVALGLCFGIPIALVSTRLIASQLFNVSPMDPLTIGLAALFLTMVAALAGFVPAQRAMRVDPMVALRCE